jgi:hypothetical protein
VRNFVTTKIGVRGGREIAGGLLVASVVSVVLGVELLIGHASTVAVVIGAVLVAAGVAAFVRHSNKRAV